MAKLLFMGARGTDDPTTATMPFIMANGARESGHDAFIVLANDAVSLMRDVVRQNIHGVGWPPFAEIFASTVEHNVPIYV